MTSERTKPAGDGDPRRRVRSAARGKSGWRWTRFGRWPWLRRDRYYKSMEAAADRYDQLAAAADARVRNTSDQSPRAGHPPRRLAWGGATALLAAAITTGLLALTQRPAHAASVQRSAAAAEHAGTFEFTQTSELTLPSGLVNVTQETGAVDLTKPAYGLRVASEAGIGLERVVLPHSLFLRHLGLAGSTPWREVKLSPPAKIAPRVGDSSGVTDPLGLLAVLRTVTGVQLLGHERIEGVPATHFRVRTTLAAFLRAERTPGVRDAKSVVVIIDAWLDSKSRLLRALRQFLLPAHHSIKLVIATRITHYGSKKVAVTPPTTRFHSPSVQRLNPLTEDPLGTGLLGALLFHSRHPGLAVKERAAR